MSGGPSRGPDDSFYLTVGGGFRVDVDGGKVVRFYGVSVAVDAGQVHDLLPRTFNKKNKDAEQLVPLALDRALFPLVTSLN